MYLERCERDKEGEYVRECAQPAANKQMRYMFELKEQESKKFFFISDRKYTLVKGWMLDLMTEIQS